MRKLVVLGVALAVVLASLATVVAPAQADRKNWPKGVSVAGSNLGSAHYAYGVGWAKILQQKLGVQTTVEATPGVAPNVRLVNSKQTDFGPITMAVAYEGYHGLGWAKGQKYDQIRAVIPMFPSYLQFWVLAKQPIRSIRDMTGQDVALSGAGSTPDIYGRKLFEMYGIKPRRIVNAGFGDMNNQLRDGLLTVCAAFAGIPHPAVVEAGTTHAIRVIGVPSKDADPFIAQYPFFSKTAIPTGTYKEHKEPIETLTIWNVMVVHKDAPEDLVYEVVKATFDARQDLITAFKGGSDTVAENIRHTTIPLHAGAYKFYREKGIQVRPEAVPPEAKR